MRITGFVAEIKGVENYPDLKKLVHKSQHSLQEFVVKNIGVESTEADYLSHVLDRWVCCINNSKCWATKT